MKIGIYDPYLDTMSGGERYMLTAALALSSLHQVTLFWDPKQKDELAILAKKRLGIDISTLHFQHPFFSKEISFRKRFQESNSYDSILLLSDGSIPILSSELILHFQSPVEWVKPSLLTYIKAKKAKLVIVNSQFTKHYIDKKFKVDSTVIYPPVVLQTKKMKKEKIISNVGRFGIKAQGSSYKKQEVLIDAFRALFASGITDWKLILVLSVRKEDEAECKKLQMLGKDLPIDYIVNPGNDVLWETYAKSTVYWHAAGFGEDLKKHPDRAEHFGISTVEAMGMGAVPIVYKAGGQKEIVDTECGFLFETIDELVQQTTKVIINEQLMHQLADNAVKKAQKFGLDVFEQKINALLQ